MGGAVPPVAAPPSTAPPMRLPEVALIAVPPSQPSGAKLESWSTQAINNSCEGGSLTQKAEERETCEDIGITTLRNENVPDGTTKVDPKSPEVGIAGSKPETAKENANTQKRDSLT